ncbi:MAG: aspartyl protease family protein, partial [Patescibacteria group bacterium]
MKFEYKYYGKNRGRRVIRPVIPVTIVFNGQQVQHEVLIDSGADDCIFSDEIATVLGIELTGGVQETVTGITGGREPYYIHKVDLIVGGHYLYYVEVGFKHMQTPGGY